VLLSLLYRLVRCLFALLAVLVRSDLSKDIELLVLRHENQVLRRAQRPPAVGSCRPGLACGVVAAGEPSPVGGDLSGHTPARIFALAP
jgi:hypothetical protein